MSQPWHLTWQFLVLQVGLGVLLRPLKPGETPKAVEEDTRICKWKPQWMHVNAIVFLWILGDHWSALWCMTLCNTWKNWKNTLIKWRNILAYKLGAIERVRILALTNRSDLRRVVLSRTIRERTQMRRKAFHGELKPGAKNGDAGQMYQGGWKFRYISLRYF